MSLDAALLVEGTCNDGKAVDDLGPEFRISGEEFQKVRKSVEGEGTQRNYVLLDTRAQTQFNMVHFPEAVNIPTAQLMKQDPPKSSQFCMMESQKLLLRTPTERS